VCGEAVLAVSYQVAGASLRADRREIAVDRFSTEWRKEHPGFRDFSGFDGEEVGLAQVDSVVGWRPAWGDLPH
jgi:hypothetical protein